LLLQSPWRVQDELVHRFVLTPEEKWVLIFILAAFVLGLTTKQYRDTHPPAITSQKVAHKSTSVASAQSGRSIPRNPARKQKTEDLGSD